MCIAQLMDYSCEHAEKKYMNQHCQCSLIVGPIVQAKGPCPARCARNLPLTPPGTPASQQKITEIIGTSTQAGGLKSETRLKDDSLYPAVCGDGEPS